MISSSNQPTLTVRSLEVYPHHIHILYQLNKIDFSTKIFYYDLNLNELNLRYSSSFLRQVYCHIALVEGLKYCSIFPKYYDLTHIADGLSEASLDFFNCVYRSAYTQNMYENQVSDYRGPELYSARKLGNLQSIELSERNQTVLVGNGGGKDSFLSMKILEEAGIPFSCFQWGRSEYGRFEYQHSLGAKLYKYLQPTQVHHVSIYDDFTDGVYMKLYHPELRPPFTLGTPECIFEALPILLHWEYHYLSFGNEKSADKGNLFWAELGQEVNHQWIKSYEAERLFHDFIQQHFIHNHFYFSLLKPLYDYRIFKNLSRYPQSLADLHSCNIDKPWCKKCPKCAYVWLSYLANFETSLVNQLFNTNPFDDPDLLLFYRQLIGLERHNAFECVGQIDESRMAMEKCLQKGLQGQVLDMYQAEARSQVLSNWNLLESKYDQVYKEHNIPELIFEQIKGLL